MRFKIQHWRSLVGEQKTLFLDIKFFQLSDAAYFRKTGSIMSDWEKKTWF